MTCLLWLAGIACCLTALPGWPNSYIQEFAVEYSLLQIIRYYIWKQRTHLFLCELFIIGWIDAKSMLNIIRQEGNISVFVSLWSVSRQYDVWCMCFWEGLLQEYSPVSHIQTALSLHLNIDHKYFTVCWNININSLQRLYVVLKKQLQLRNGSC